MPRADTIFRDYNAQPDAVLPPKASPLGLRSWMREMAVTAAWNMAPPPFPDGPLPRGKGETILLIPGFLVGDWALSRLAEFLSEFGYRPEFSGTPLNLGPTLDLITRLEQRLAALAGERGPIVLIGPSLGGVFSRYLARTHPEHVRRVITLCSPVRFPVTTPLAPFVQALAPLHASEFRAAREFIAAPLPMPLTALYSEEDGIVDWRQCLPDEGPDQELVRVSGAHSVIGSNPQAQRVIAEVLAREAS